MYKYLIIFIFLGFFKSNAQNAINYKIGFSFHGTGDMYGFSNSLSYQNNSSRKFVFQISFTNTNHFRTEKFRWIDTAGQVFTKGHEVIGDYRFNTYGYQLNPSCLINFHIGRKTKLYLNLGGIVRFERQNVSGVYNTIYTSDPDIKFPIIINDNQTDGVLWTLGYLGGIGLSHQINNKWGYSIDFIELQNDTQGQIIWKLPLIGITRYIND